MLGFYFGSENYLCIIATLRCVLKSIKLYIIGLFSLSNKWGKPLNAGNDFFLYFWAVLPIQKIKIKIPISYPSHHHAGSSSSRHWIYQWDMPYSKPLDITEINGHEKIIYFNFYLI